MDARRPCPDSALLAAFLDGMLTGYERSAVVSHLADCAVCRQVALAVVEFQELAAHDAEWQPAAPAGEPAAIETREKRWSSEKTRAPAMVAISAVLLTVAAVPLFYSSFEPRPSQPVQALASVAEGQRPTAARVSGGFPFAAGRPSTPLPPQSPLVLVASRVRADYAEDYGPASRRAVGIAALVAGDADDAVSSLAIAALAAPSDAEIANDLAAAYYERARRLGSADDLPAALDAAERAVRMEPELLEAWFNRALIITALGLRIEAKAAWQDYVRRDSNSRWADEARAREQQLAPAESPAGWMDLQRDFERDPTTESAKVLVERHPSHARELFETLLSAWTKAASTGQDAPSLRARMSALGGAFSQVQRDRFYEDVAASITTAATGSRHRALAAAHLALSKARALPIAAAPERASRALLRAGVLLRGAGSPLAFRAQMEALTAAYFARRYDGAAVRLPELGRAAVARNYRVIATRAWWMLGLVEFGRNDLAAARRAYEAMLAESRPPADLDQFVAANLLLSNLHEVLGDNRRAWAYRIAAMHDLDEVQTPSTVVNILLSAAGHSFVAGHYGAALLFQSRVLAKGDAVNPVSEMQARTQRARTLIQLRDYSAARSELDRARQRLSVVAPSLRAHQEADLLDIESQLLQPSQPGEALRLAERGLEMASRTRDLFRVSRLQMRLAESSLAAGDLNRADEAASQGVALLEALRAAAESTDTVSDHERPLYAKAAQIAIRRGDLARAFAYTERSRLQALEESPGHASAVLSLPGVQQKLDADTALAILNQLSDQLHIWIVTRDDVVVHSAGLPASSAAGLVLSQWQELTQGASAPRIGAQLFDIVIRPVLPHLRRVRTVVFVADGPYRDVALAGLYDRERERYLVEDFRLIAAPSASSFVRSGRDPRDPRRGDERFAIVSAGGGRTSPPPSPMVAAELVALYKSADSKSGDSATPTELLNQIAERDVVHISTPLAGSGNSRATTALVVADEAGRTYSGSVSAQRLAAAATVRAKLVTLDPRIDAATVASPGASQELARALLAAGVATVVGPVGPPMAANLDRTWIEFHRRYAAGAPAAESLQRAQLAALGASNRRPGPWAVLTVFGSNQ